MTSPVSTKNTKDNRMIVSARYSAEAYYKLPHNLDLEDKTIVKSYTIYNRVLYIHYTSAEYYKQYSGNSNADNNNIQTIQEDEELELIAVQYPEHIELMTARDRSVVYTDDETN